MHRMLVPARRAALAAALVSALASTLAGCGPRDPAPARARAAAVAAPITALSFDPAPPAQFSTYDCVPVRVVGNGQADTDLYVRVQWALTGFQLYSDALCQTGKASALTIPAGSSETELIYLRQSTARAGQILATAAGATEARVSYTVVDTPLAFAQEPPQSVQAGSPVTVVVGVGELINTAVRVSLEDLDAGTSAPIDSWNVVPSSLTAVTFTPTSGRRLQLYAEAGTATARSREFGVTAAAPVRLGVAPGSFDAIAGEYIGTISVSVFDVYGNPVPATTVTVSPWIPGGTFRLTGDTQRVTDDTGVAEFATLATTTAGGVTLQAAASGAWSDLFGGRISPARPTLAFLQDPTGPCVAGGTVEPVVELRDQYRNSRDDTVSLSLEDGGGVTVPGSAQQVRGTTSAGARFTMTTSGTWYVRVTDGPWTARSGPITVAAASPSSLSLGLPRSSLRAGERFSATATVRDQFGNAISTPVTLSLAGATGATLSGTVSRTTSAATGEATFDDLHVDRAGRFTLAASVPGLADTVQTIAISPGTPIVTVTSPPQPLSADDGFDVAVQVQDALENPIPAAGVTLFLDPAHGGTLEGTTIATTSATGAAAFPALAVRRAGAGYRITARVASAETGTSGPFDVAPGTPDLSGFTFTTPPPSSLVAGEAFPVAVRLVDGHGNPIATTVSLALDPTAKLSGGPSAATDPATGIAEFSSLSIPRAGSYAVRASVSAPVPLARSSGGVTVRVGPASRLAFLEPPPAAVTADDVFPVSLRLEDACGNAADGTITLALAEDGAVVPISSTADVLSSPTAGGVVVFPEVALRRAGGPYQLVATLGSPALTATSTSVEVAPGAPTALAFTAPPPAAVAAGEPFTVAARVTDAWVNPISTVVALALSATNGAVLSGATPQATDPSGVATFVALSIARAGTGYALTASTTSPALAATAPLEVTPAAAVVTVTADPPATLTADATFPVTVQVLDAYENPVATTVTLGLEAANGATLAGALSASTDAAGFVRFAGLAVRRAGAGYRISARTDAGQLGLGGAFAVAPATPEASGLAFTTAPPATVVAGDPFDAAVRLVDPYGNAIASTVRLALEPAGAGALSGPTAQETGAGGVAPFTALSIATAGTYTLRAAVTSPVSLSVARPVTVGPAPASHLVFLEQPPPAPTADDELRVAVRVADRFDNPVDATVAVTIVAANDAVLEVTTTAATLAAPAVGGLAAFPHLAIRKAGGPYQLLAVVTSPPLVAASADFTVGAGAASGLRFRSFTATTGQQGIRLPAISVAVEDAWGNVAPEASAPVSLSIDAGPPGATMTGGEGRAPVRGVATFAAVILSAPGTYRLRASDGALTRLAPAETVVLAPGSTSPAHHLAFTVVPPPQVDVGACSGFRLEVHDEGTAYVAPRRISMTSVVTAELSQVAGLSFHPDATCDAAGITTVEIGLAGVGEFHVKARAPGSFTVAAYADLSGQNGSTVRQQSVARDLLVGDRPIDGGAAAPKETDPKPLNGWSAGCGVGGAPSALALLALAAAAMRRPGRAGGRGRPGRGGGARSG